jgi:hypothetical protein
LNGLVNFNIDNLKRSGLHSRTVSDLARLQTCLNLATCGFDLPSIARRMNLKNAAEASRLLTRAFKVCLLPQAEQARLVLLSQASAVVSDLIGRCGLFPHDLQGPRAPLDEAQGRTVALLLKALDLSARLSGVQNLQPVNPVAPGSFQVTVLNFCAPAPTACESSHKSTSQTLIASTNNEVENAEEIQASTEIQAETDRGGYTPKTIENPGGLNMAPSPRSPAVPAVAG